MITGMEKSTTHSMQVSLQTFAKKFNEQFEKFLSQSSDVPEELAQAIRYSALSSGKRVRPFLVGRCCELVGGRIDDVWAPAMAIECVHSFSLIHDDLPAMDDDDLRRGQPTCHKKFGEATAMLAGNSLVVMAFEIIAGQITDSVLSMKMVLELAEAVGWSGMIGGQAADVQGESAPPSLDLVRYIHGRKTACLFSIACRFGAMMGKSDVETMNSLGQFGQKLGHLFQMADDLLDVSSTTTVLGKPVGQDARVCKQTYPQCIGIDESRDRLRKGLQETIDALKPFGAEADDLRDLVRFVVDRNY